MDIEALKDKLLDRAPTCFLCRWVLRDLAENGKLTEFPGKSIDGSSSFPPAAKVKHLKLEGIWDSSLERILI